MSLVTAASSARYTHRAKPAAVLPPLPRSFPLLSHPDQRPGVLRSRFFYAGLRAHKHGWGLGHCSLRVPWRREQWLKGWQSVA